MIGFWHLVFGKLCLPSQYAEEFADLSASHAICQSSDSWAKKTRDVLLSLMVEQFMSLLPDISICIRYENTDHSFMRKRFKTTARSLGFTGLNVHKMMIREPVHPLL